MWLRRADLECRVARAADDLGLLVLGMNIWLHAGSPAASRRERCLGLDDADALLVAALVLELDAAVDGGEDGVVPAQAGARTGQEGHAALAHDDRAGA